MKKISLILIGLMITLSIYPVVQSQNYQQNNNDEEYAEIHILFNLDDNNIHNIIEMSSNDAINFIEKIKEIDQTNNNFNDSLSFTINFLKEKDLLVTNYSHYELEQLIKEKLYRFNNNTFFNSIYQPKNLQGSILNVACGLQFFIDGKGFVIGIHTVPTIGSIGPDLFGIFEGDGNVRTFGGIYSNQEPLSGYINGWYFGFFGLMVFCIVPFKPGPVIYAIGVTIFTSWRD